eukprot:16268-Heterococcus_DN1.PRE.2
MYTQNCLNKRQEMTAKPKILKTGVQQASTRRVLPCIAALASGDEYRSQVVPSVSIVAHIHVQLCKGVQDIVDQAAFSSNRFSLNVSGRRDTVVLLAKCRSSSHITQSHCSSKPAVTGDNASSCKAHCAHFDCMRECVCIKAPVVGCRNAAHDTRTPF